MAMEENIMDSLSLCRATEKPENAFVIPRERALLQLPCCGPNCDNNQPLEWSCEICKAILKYGFDDYVYCRCGRIEPSRLKFRCSNLEHTEFTNYKCKTLMGHIEKLVPITELNILILGETGVGKSTFINGFANFLTYDSLEEALKGRLITLIPSKFTVANENYEQVTVSTGSDPNEIHEKGQSATQTTKVYPFSLGNLKLRLIDTPGIGDTRGKDQDDKNLENILETLNLFDEIHGICILTKPNSTRITGLFRFCIDELLKHMHRDAARNIAFCFTNSRGTFYRPGETLTSLKKLLAENKEVSIPLNKETIYCFDSEAYRYLAAVKNDPPVYIDADEKEHFARSWTKSLAELKRLLARFCIIQPHYIKHTLNLNFARKLAKVLNRPLISIIENIQENTEIVQNESKAIEEGKVEIYNLKKLIYKRFSTFEVQFKPFPENSEDMSLCQIGYAFYLDVATSMGLTQEYRKLKAARKLHGKAGYFEMVERKKRVTDKEVKRVLKAKKNTAETKAEILKLKTNEIKEYENEMKVLRQALAKFAVFLQASEITSYNDATLKHFEDLINAEKSKTDANKDARKISRLIKSRQMYLDEKKRMKLDKSGNLATAEIDALVTNLKALKHAGPAILQALQCDNFIDDAHSQILFEKNIQQNTKQLQPKEYWLTWFCKVLEATRPPVHGI